MNEPCDHSLCHDVGDATCHINADTIPPRVFTLDELKDS